MLSQDEFVTWCCTLNLSPNTKQLIEDIRLSPPSRRVKGGRGNVSGSYPSRKMGVTIQFESHKCELARIYELEHDPDVLGYYDQPPAIELIYQTKNGGRNRHSYTPDFFIIRGSSAGWEECKPTEALEKLSVKSPYRYNLDEAGSWRCPPAEEYASRFGLFFNVWTNANVNWIFQDNCVWLDDYLRSKSLSVSTSSVAEIMNFLGKQQGATLAELLQTKVSADEIYTLIATQQVYVDLNSARLSQPEKVIIARDKERAIAYAHLQETVSKSWEPSFPAILVEPGSSISWDGQVWEVLNPGNTTIGLLRSDGKFIDLPNNIFYELIQSGKISTPNVCQAENPSQEAVEAILSRASLNRHRRGKQPLSAHTTIPRAEFATV